jgi:FtsH-binding integral membrane protein
MHITAGRMHASPSLSLLSKPKPPPPPPPPPTPTRQQRQPRAPRRHNHPHNHHDQTGGAAPPPPPPAGYPGGAPYQQGQQQAYAQYPPQQQQQQQPAHTAVPVQPMGVAGAPGAAPVGAESATPGLAAFGRAFSKRDEGDHDLATAATFATTALRNGFIRKVFLIVAAMLAVTTGVTFALLSSTEAKRWLMRNQWLSWVFFAGSLVLLLVMACVPGVTRKHPLNLALLFGFTAMMSGVVAIASTAYGTNAAGIAFLVTAAAVVGLTLFAMQTKYDVTKWGSILFVMLIVLIVLMLIGIFWRSPIYQLVISGVAALLFSVYILYDVQLIM